MRSGNNTPYWLKGGIIGIFVSIILTVIVLSNGCYLFDFISENGEGFCGGVLRAISSVSFLFTPSFIAGFLILIVFQAISSTSIFFNMVGLIIADFVFFAIPLFVIGSLIGLVITLSKKKIKIVK